MSDISFIQVEVTLRFQRNLRKLAKKYPKIHNDIQPVIEQLKKGEILGDCIPKIGYEVFKLRVKNSNLQKGKSAGYRLIYYVKTATAIILLTIYAKSEQANITPDEIQSIISEYEPED